MLRLYSGIAEIVKIELCDIILHLGDASPERDILGKLLPANALFRCKRMLSVDHKAMVVADRACLAYLIIKHIILRDIENKINISAA